MVASNKYAGKARSIPGGMTIATSVSMVITFMLSLIIASCLNREKLNWEQAGYCIMGMLFLASFIGGKCAYVLIKRQRMLVSVMSGMLYWGSLLCITALFFGGKFGAVWETAGIIGAGSGVAALILFPNPHKYRRKSGKSLSLS